MMLSRRSFLVFLWLAGSSVTGVHSILRGMEAQPKELKRRTLVELMAYNNMDKPDKLGLCEGKCKKDSDCDEGLICFKRDDNEAVPHCEGGLEDNSNTDYCTYEFDMLPEPSAIPSASPSDTPSPLPTSATPSKSPSKTPSMHPVSSPSASPIPTNEFAFSASLPIKERISLFALEGGAEFFDPDSYQSKALAKTEAQVGIETMTDAKIIQYYALYCIFTATNKVPNEITNSDPRFEDIDFPEWNIKRNWEETDVDPCSEDGWHGIECKDDLVIGIDLYGNILTGIFPPEIILLASDGIYSTGAGNLNRLDLYNNEFLTNGYDNSWITHLGSNFELLYLQLTGFAGDLPKFPENLYDLDMSYSLISGGLEDKNFEGMNNLNYVILDGNAFNSTVPSVFGQLPNLEYLYLTDSYIFGDLSYMEGMPSIIEHWVDNNKQLSGPLPTFLGDLESLQSFSAVQNNLTGELPTELGKLSNMIQFWVYDNQLSGTIPEELWMLPRLKILELEGNSFTGSMPNLICVSVQFFGMLEVIGADCDDANFECACCTCCGLEECQPWLFE